LLVIFGAITIFRNGNTNKLHGEFIPNSVYIWDPAIKPPGSRGRKRRNAEAWEDIPSVVKDANIIPDQTDYHGNFNADIFENLFEKLCESISIKYGAVDIHMDGARYHKRHIESIPTSSSRKAEIIDWLTNQGITFPTELQKPELLELVQKNKEKIPFASVEIAKKYGHQVFFTPPYHCELQPIEGIWAIVKGEVARSGPHSDLLSVRNKLLYAFTEKINSKIIIGFWKRALEKAKDYRESNEYAILLDEETNHELSDAYSSDNNN